MCSPSERSGNSEKSMTIRRAKTRLPSQLRVLALLLLLALFGSLAATSDAQEPVSAFTGTWTGTMTITLLMGDARKQPMSVTTTYQLRILSNGRVQVFTDRSKLSRASRKWRRLAIPFALIEVGEGLVVSGQNGSQYWAETQTFNLTKLDDDTLLVYLWRVVDNYLATENRDDYVWAAGGHAEFQRMSPW
jgi:hypothetical protein